MGFVFRLEGKSFMEIMESVYKHLCKKIFSGTGNIEKNTVEIETWLKNMFGETDKLKKLKKTR